MSRQGKASYVDETLFGNGNGQRTRPKGPSSAPASRTRVKEAPAAVISYSELQRIKQSSIIKTRAQEEEDREAYELEKEQREKVSKDRKIRMQELERHAVQSSKKSDMEVAKEAKEEAIRKLAKEKVDDSTDLVKMLNSLGTRAAAFTIRDAQLNEKKEREKKEDEYNRRMDMEMEIDRLKDLQKRKELDQIKLEKRIEDKKVIVEQMDYRQRMKILAAESREQENIAMRGVIKQYEVEAEETASRKAIEIGKSKLEVLKANEDSIQRKLQNREMEKKEMQDILIYQQSKDAEMLKRELEEAANENIKKERQAKLLAQQEKAQNNAGKLDEVRARRAAEEHERRARNKEREDAAKRKAATKELLESRAKQAAARRAKEEQDGLLWQEEHRNGLEYMKMMSERETNEKHHKHQEAINHRNHLLNQVNTNAEVRNKESTGRNEAGVEYRQDLIREESKLMAIRDHMVKDMVNKGVNPKYLGEMKAVDIGKMLRR